MDSTRPARRCYFWGPVLVLSVACVAPVARAAPEEHPTPPAFIVGVFSQPGGSAAGWKARGVNTMVRYENEGGRLALGDWSGLVVDQGMFMIRQPDADPKGDLDEPYLLAWMHDDEPEQREGDTPEKLARDYASLKGVAKAGNKNVPVFVNFSGHHILYKKTPRETYDAYLKAADWVGQDFYPVTGWNKPDWVGKSGELMDLLRQWAGDKPQLCFIECSAQRLTWTPKETRGPTPDEMRGEIWDAVIHGASGIVYFPQQIGEGFKYDATTPDVQAEMLKQNKLLAEWGSVLAGKMNPPGAGAGTDAPLEVGWRVKDGKTYFIVLNCSNQPLKNQAVKLKGITASFAMDESKHAVKIESQKLSDSFLPYEVHIYRVE